MFTIHCHIWDQVYYPHSAYLLILYDSHRQNYRLNNISCLLFFLWRNVFLSEIVTACLCIIQVNANRLKLVGSVCIPEDPMWVLWLAEVALWIVFSEVTLFYIWISLQQSAVLIWINIPIFFHRTLQYLYYVCNACYMFRPFM